MAQESHETESHGRIDPATGMSTTGHSWDNIEELNFPLPRWWLWTFYATIVWAIGYWVVYPAWPLVSSYTTGTFGWHSRDAIIVDMDELKAKRAEQTTKLASASLEQIRTDPNLLNIANAQAKVVFADNCATCHGDSGIGAKGGYPNLQDDDWLWGGTLEQIQATITDGARFSTDYGHQGSMTPFADVLKKEEISLLADYVRSLSGLPSEAKPDLEKAKQLFADNCAVCHGDDAKGNQELGSPNLTDGIWLYGSDKATIVETITKGRGNTMPAWKDRLDAETIKALTVYVHSFGGGK